MSRPIKPLWTTAPSRFAGLSRTRARLGLAALGLFLFAAGNLPRGDEAASGLTLSAGAAEAIRHGGEYYRFIADALRSGGGATGRLAFPPPTLAAVAASIPGLALSGLLSALAVAVLMAWRPVLNGALARSSARWGASLLLAAGLIPYLLPEVLYVPEVWAGLLIALSLGRWARGALIEAAAFGLAAAVIRETAGTYLLVMLMFAIGSHDRREALGWSAASGVFALVMLTHWRTVWQVSGPMTEAGDAGRLGLTPLIGASPFALLPTEAPLVVLGLAAFSWTAWREKAGLRIVATTCAVALFALMRPEVGGDWGYLVAAPLLAGLAFAPDGLRDLVRAARGERRRITVTRVAR